ncbi:MAG: hypothetical protein AAF579_01195 [Cyanobacteria bacterium P01_C01_bin.118]
MNAALLSAIIATVTSVGVVLLQSGLQSLTSKRQRMTTINSEYLNPLRLYAEETFFRLYEIDERFARGQKENLLFLAETKTPQQLSSQSDAWFNGEGCYFVSTCYFTACLFACINKVRADMPYLKLGKTGDTELLSRMFAVNRGFLQELGIFYAIQHSIGSELYLTKEQRLLTYREFCQLLENSETRVWFDRLLMFYMDINGGQRMPMVAQSMRAIYNLSKFCDHIVQGNSSIDARLRLETKPSFK